MLLQQRRDLLQSTTRQFPSRCLVQAGDSGDSGVWRSQLSLLLGFLWIFPRECLHEHGEESYGSVRDSHAGITSMGSINGFAGSVCRSILVHTRIRPETRSIREVKSLENGLNERSHRPSWSGVSVECPTRFLEKRWKTIITEWQAMGGARHLPGENCTMWRYGHAGWTSAE